MPKHGIKVEHWESTHHTRVDLGWVNPNPPIPNTISNPIWLVRMKQQPAQTELNLNLMIDLVGLGWCLTLPCQPKLNLTLINQWFNLIGLMFYHPMSTQTEPYFIPNLLMQILLIQLYIIWVRYKFWDRYTWSLLLGFIWTMNNNVVFTFLLVETLAVSCNFI